MNEAVGNRPRASARIDGNGYVGGCRVQRKSQAIQDCGELADLISPLLVTVAMAKGPAAVMAAHHWKNRYPVPGEQSPIV